MIGGEGRALKIHIIKKRKNYCSHVERIKTITDFKK